MNVGSVALDGAEHCVMMLRVRSVAWGIFFDRLDRDVQTQWQFELAKIAISLSLPRSHFAFRVEKVGQTPRSLWPLPRLHVWRRVFGGVETSRTNHITSLTRFLFLGVAGAYGCRTGAHGKNRTASLGYGSGRIHL